MDGKQLKNSILQWAIQGKLVPQNPKDEPASKLLERITAIRHSEQSEESSKRSKKTSKTPTSRIYRENGVWYEQIGNAEPKDISDDIPFEIPENWAWCRLAQLAEIQSSKRVFEKDYVATGIPFFRSKEIGELSRGESIHTELYITKQHYKELKEKYGVPQIGDILLTSVGSIGNLWICDGREFYYKDGNVTQICGNACFDSQYVALYLSSPFFFEQIRSSVAGTAYNALTIVKLKSLILPLPPLAEQKRIVAKLEKVLPIVDEYDVAQEQLDKLNKELPEALKKSILQQAIQGKLVPQNPKDEPAQKLLERIASCRHSEQSEESSKRSKKTTKNPTSRIYCENGIWYEQIGNAEPKDISDEIPFEIPTSWAWCRVENISQSYIGLTYKPQDVASEGTVVLRSSNIKNGQIVLDDIVRVKMELSEKYYVQENDILICARNGSKKLVGKAALIPKLTEKMTFGAFMAICKTPFYAYVYYYLMSDLFYSQLWNVSGTTTINQLTQNNFNRFLVPLPPLAEQKRIVTKLEQLFKVL